jgi:hypothetical protein
VGVASHEDDGQPLEEVLDRSGWCGPQTLRVQVANAPLVEVGVRFSPSHGFDHQRDKVQSCFLTVVEMFAHLLPVSSVGGYTSFGGSSRDVGCGQRVDDSHVQSSFSSIPLGRQKDVCGLRAFSKDSVLCLFRGSQGSCLGCGENGIAHTIVAKGEVTPMAAGDGMKAEGVIMQSAGTAVAVEGVDL